METQQTEITHQPDVLSKAKDLGRFSWAPITVVCAFALVKLRLFIPAYFAEDPLQYDRIILTLLAASQLIPLLWRGARSHFRRKALWIVFPASLVLIAYRAHVIGSKDLAMYAYLALLAGIVAGIYDAEVTRRATAMFAGLAALIYPPHVIYAPAAEWLRTLGLKLASLVTTPFFHDVAYSDQTITISGLPVAYTASCSGANFLMVYVALALIMFGSRVRSRRLAGEIGIAAVLAVGLNVARVVLMVVLTRAGYQDLALGSGHAALGEAFIFAGVVYILYRADAATSP